MNNHLPFVTRLIINDYHLCMRKSVKSILKPIGLFVHPTYINNYNSILFARHKSSYKSQQSSHSSKQPRSDDAHIIPSKSSGTRVWTDSATASQSSPESPPTIAISEPQYPYQLNHIPPNESPVYS